LKYWADAAVTLNLGRAGHPSPIFINIGDRNTTFIVKCNLCGETSALEIPIAGFRRWQYGELIQNALPELDPRQRELLISRTCSKCFDELFKTGE